MPDDLRAMQLYLHPTRHEALTATEKAITRWPLDTNPATILAEFSTAPEYLFTLMYDAGGRAVFMGGITGSPDGMLFALSPLQPREGHFTQPNMIEWRRWDDLLPARSSEVPDLGPEVESLAASPDGRWLVVGSEYAEQLFLLDWQTGEVISHHTTDQCNISGLTFDATSTFVAGTFSSYDGGSFLELWRLEPAERFVPRPPVEDWWTHSLIPKDEVTGPMALTLLYADWDWLGVEWPNQYLADAPGWVAFSPDSRIMLFSLHSTIGVGGYELVAFEVPSAKLLWCARHAEASSGPFIFSPDGSILLVPVQGGDLLAHRAEDGTLVQRLPTGLSEPVQALAFDHNGKTLWLATEEELVQYQPQR
jgi:WD40 repeat protein